MKAIKKFNIGSYAFFKDYKDYDSKDKDILAIMDRFVGNHNSLNMKLKGEDIFMYRRMNKMGFITDALESNVPMRAGKFLVPEFSEYIGLTINDLKRLAKLFEEMDDAHKYEKIIYDAYIENNSFTLTDKQRDAAYKVYKESRSSKEK